MKDHHSWDRDIAEELKEINRALAAFVRSNERQEELLAGLVGIPLERTGGDE